MSTVNLLPSDFLGIGENYRMDTQPDSREAKINFINRRMRELGLNPRSLALRAGLHQDAVRNLLSGKSKSWLAGTENKIMAILSQNRAAILGAIGANDEVKLIDNFDAIINKSAGELNTMECETFAVPSEFSHIIVHVWKVEKEWEGPLLSGGDRLYTTEITYNNFENFLNSEILVHLADGRTYIKKLLRGSDNNKYSLMGVSVHGFMRDIEIAWCAQIIGHIKKMPA